MPWRGAGLSSHPRDRASPGSFHRFSAAGQSGQTHSSRDDAYLTVPACSYSSHLNLQDSVLSIFIACTCFEPLSLRLSPQLLAIPASPSSGGCHNLPCHQLSSPARSLEHAPAIILSTPMKEHPETDTSPRSPGMQIPEPQRQMRQRVICPEPPLRILKKHLERSWSTSS
jgi:hypothetical protein